jgi:hypothetical protein
MHWPNILLLQVQDISMHWPTIQLMQVQDIYALAHYSACAKQTQAYFSLCFGFYF